jgi:hypothetical protein
MGKATFHHMTGFQVYGTDSDSKQLMVCWSGLVSEYFGFMALKTDPEKVLKIGRMYFYLSGLLKTINARFDPDQRTTRPADYWLDIDDIGRHVGEISNMFSNWFGGGEFREAVILYHGDLILACLNNLCFKLNISTKAALTIAEKTIPAKMRRIRGPNLRYPFIRAPGRKINPGMSLANMEDKYWQYVAKSQHRIQTDYIVSLKNSKYIPYEDKEWLRCFNTIIDEVGQED